MKRRKNRLIDIRTRLAVTVLNIASRSDFKPDFRSLSSTKKTKSPIRLCQIIHLQANRYALSIFSFGKLVKKQLRHTTSFMSIRRQFWHFNIGSKNANGKKYDSAYVSQSRNPNTNFDFENDVKWTFSIGRGSPGSWREKYRLWLAENRDQWPGTRSLHNLDIEWCSLPASAERDTW